MFDVNNPLTWPLFPVLAVRRRGKNYMMEENCLGIIGCTKLIQPRPVVLVCNLYGISNRTLTDLYADPAIPKEEFSSMEALLEVWEVD